MRTGAASTVGARRHNENDVIMKTGAASAARRNNENDITMTIASLRRYAAMGCTALVLLKNLSANINIKNQMVEIPEDKPQSSSNDLQLLSISATLSCLQPIF